MYERHFGLEKRPFSVKATGTEVFVGPQTAKTMAGFRRALAVQDAVVTVSGAVGTGKTTLVERALDAIGSRYKTIRVGRMQMDASDVLESLLIVLGVKDRPSGTIQRFTALRRKLKDLQDAGTRVFILVEDALRAGPETLAELEALTVADAGESDGASIVLMGDERLFEFMKDPALAQLQQRVRQRHRIMPLCVAEMRGYLKHCLRMAGGDFDQIFDARSAELIHGLSEGIPRVANTVVDAVLVAATSQGVEKISAKMIAAVASDEFGLGVEDFDFTIPAEADLPIADPTPRSDTADAAQQSVPVEEAAAAANAKQALPAPDAVAEPAPVADVMPADEQPAPVEEATPDIAAEEPMPDVDAIAAPVEAIAEDSDTAPDPVIVFADAEEEATDESLDIPHLIQDTLPDLAILSQRYATLKDDHEAEPQESTVEQSAEPAIDEIPELVQEASPETPSANIPELVPALDIDPTPKLDAGVADIPDLRAESAPDPVAENIPELSIEPEAIAEPVSVAPPELEVELTAADSETSQSQTSPGEEAIPEWDRDPTLAQLKPDLDALEQAMAFTHSEEPLLKGKDAALQPEKLAENVADLDEIPEIILDKSIETGIENLDVEEPSDIRPPTPAKKTDPELDRIAADIANAKSLEDIDDIMAETLFGTGISMIAEQIKANPPPDVPANDELQLAQEPPAAPAPAAPKHAPPAAPKKAAPNSSDAAEEISLETRSPVVNAGLDLSASQRLKTVRALNADLHPSLREPENAPVANGKKAANSPQPIEDQINTSITQTLKALKIPPEVLDDDADDEPKKGFLSRFRRS